MKDGNISEEIVNLIQAIADDASLCDWLFELEHRPLPARVAALAEMGARMKAGGEDAGLVRAVSALAEPEIYAAVCSTLRDLRL
jgi:hypothetical protein